MNVFLSLHHKIGPRLLCRSVLLRRLILHLHLHLELPTAVINYLWLIALEGHMWCSHVCGRRCVTVTSCCCFSNKWRCCCSVCILVGESWFSGLRRLYRIAHRLSLMVVFAFCIWPNSKSFVMVKRMKSYRVSVVIIDFTIKSVDKLCGESIF